MFQNREEAGLLLSKRLDKYKNKSDVLVLGIPRGGVVVANVIAKNINSPYNVIIVKKLRAPHNSELAIGALGPDGVKYIDWQLALRLGIEQAYLDQEIERKRREIEERTRKFEIRNSKFEINHKIQIPNYKTIILTDDGVATGATVLAAIKYIKNLKPTTYNLSPKIILAVPVIAKDTYDKLKSEVDRIVALEIAESFGAVGEFYREFPQISDEEVLKIITNKYQ